MQIMLLQRMSGYMQTCVPIRAAVHVHLGNAFGLEAIFCQLALPVRQSHLLSLELSDPEFNDHLLSIF